MEEFSDYLLFMERISGQSHGFSSYWCGTSCLEKARLSLFVCAYGYETVFEANSEFLQVLCPLLILKVTYKSALLLLFEMTL